MLDPKQVLRNRCAAHQIFDFATPFTLRHLFPLFYLLTCMPHNPLSPTTRHPLLSVTRCDRCQACAARCQAFIPVTTLRGATHGFSRPGGNFQLMRKKLSAGLHAAQKLKLLNLFFFTNYKLSTYA